ncbi:MAG: exodeoxyribonuclease III [Bacteroidetes bacterium]|nr:MAG: exodeoxyribonuclease III [Bacteroidota bacterium]GIV58697.1 MAG: exodeoxyribonuclease III [Rhodothermaceae bacterium]
MKIATWNVNSIRARMERVRPWLEAHAPDLVCLQEIKTTDADFPYADVEALGYRAAVHGQKTYNGVAILSRRPADEVHRRLDGEDTEARFLAARFGDLHLLNVYVPNGAVVGSDKWAYKLAWLRQLRDYLAAHHRPDERLVLCGDFNVAPEPRDVARPDAWAESVLFHPEARRALAELTDWGLVDLLRLHHEGPGPYTWWDYRNLAFPKNDGLRIDHLFATRPMAERCTDAFVDREARKGPKPSDHAPVVAVFAD